jgi:putative transposase
MSVRSQIKDYIAAQSEPKRSDMQELHGFILKMMPDAFIESFNGKFRDACLNQHWFTDLHDARRTIDAWRRHYNEVRPHSALGYLPPAVFAKRAA